ncbi:TRAP-type C4-dicarboxylate transport system substrate-binding protein [Amorphus suaedae]
MRHLAFAGALAGLIFTGTAQAQSTNMKMSLWIPPMHPLVASLKDWGADLSQSTNGEITVSVFPAQQLGQAADHYDMARDGIVDMAMVAPGYSAGRFPLWSMVELPFTFKNSTGGAKALHEWYAKYAETEMPDVRVCLITLHHPGTLHTVKTEVRTPKDLQGMRIRPAGPVTSALVTRSGGATVQAALPEIRELAERGVVDGVTWPWDIFVIKADSVLKYHMDAPFYITAQAHVINKDFYDGLTASQQAALDAHCTPEWSEKVNEGWAKGELAAHEKLKSLKDHHLYSLTPEELAAWQEAAAPLVDEVLTAAGERYNIDANAVHQELVDALKANDAAY